MPTSLQDTVSPFILATLTVVTILLLSLPTIAPIAPLPYVAGILLAFTGTLTMYVYAAWMHACVQETLTEYQNMQTTISS